jgi:hypothetical protein
MRDDKAFLYGFGKAFKAQGISEGSTVKGFKALPAAAG